MWGRVAALVVAISGMWTGWAAAQAPAIPENPRYVFPTTPEVVVKLVQPNTQRSIRGKLISLTALEVIVDTGKLSAEARARGEIGQRISFDRIESLHSSDGRFRFTPEENFKTVSQRIVAAYTSVTVEGSSATPDAAGNISNPDPATVGHMPTVPVPMRKPPVNGLGQGGFGGIKNLPKPKKPDPSSADIPAEATGTQGTSDPATPPDVDPTAGATEVLLCSNCAKEIPASAIKTGVCPHCKIAFSNVTPAPSTPASNPFQKTAGSGTGNADPFAPTTPAASAASVPPANTGSQVESVGFSIEAIPNWAKGGLFVLLVLVGWHLVFNR